MCFALEDTCLGVQTQLIRFWLWRLRIAREFRNNDTLAENLRCRSSFGIAKSNRLPFIQGWQCHPVCLIRGKFSTTLCTLGLLMWRSTALHLKTSALASTCLSPFRGLLCSAYGTFFTCTWNFLHRLWILCAFWMFWRLLPIEFWIFVELPCQSLYHCVYVLKQQR